MKERAESVMKMWRCRVRNKRESQYAPISDKKERMGPSFYLGGVNIQWLECAVSGSPLYITMPKITKVRLCSKKQLVRFYFCLFFLSTDFSSFCVLKLTKVFSSGSN